MTPRSLQCLTEGDIRNAHEMKIEIDAGSIYDWKQQPHTHLPKLFRSISRLNGRNVYQMS